MKGDRGGVRAPAAMALDLMVEVERALNPLWHPRGAPERVEGCRLWT